MNNFYNNIYKLIFIFMIVGLAIGALAIRFCFEPFVHDWITPIGSIFIRLLELIALPLLFVSVVKGVINLENTTKLASLAGRTLLYYFITTSIAVVLGVALVLAINPGGGIDVVVTNDMITAGSTEVSAMVEGASEYSDQSPLAPLVEVIPNSVVKAFSGSSTMLQALVLAVMLGVTIVTIKNDRVETFRRLINDIDTLLSHSINLVMWIAPLGIMALMTNVVIGSGGDIGLLGALGMYALTCMVGFAIMAFVIYPLAIKVFTKRDVSHYIRSLVPAQLMAISTSSSAATLPLTMKVATEDLNISKKTTSFTLPMGVTVNMDGSSIYLAVTTIFVAQVTGVDLGFTQLLAIIFTAIIASVGTPGVPGGVLMTIIMVLSSVGIPPEGVALIIALGRPIDMFVTAVNVTGDIAVSAIVDSKRD